MENSQQPYEHLSPRIYRTIEQGHFEYAQTFLSLQSELPLERMLAVVEKHRKSAFRLVHQVHLCAFRMEGREPVWRESTKEYQDFTRDLLDTPDFPYSAQEVVLVGKLQNRVSGNGNAIVIDRIVLRKMLEGTQDAAMREYIWYGLTLTGNNGEAVRYLRKKHGENASSIIAEMERAVLPAYHLFLEELATQVDAERQNRSLYFVERAARGDAISVHQNIASARKDYLETILLYNAAFPPGPLQKGVSPLDLISAYEKRRRKL